MRALSSETHCFAIYRFTPIPMTILNSFRLPLPSPRRRAAGMQKKAPFRLLHFHSKGSLCHAPAQASVCIFRAVIASCLLQFVYAPAKKMRDFKGRSRLSARSALQSVSRFEVSAGDPRPVAAGFPIGARSIPVGTRFCSAKSSVLYLCFRLTRERGWRRTLRCGRVWQQTLFRGSRTGGFCDAGYGTNAGFLRSKIRLSGKGSKGI